MHDPPARVVPHPSQELGQLRLGEDDVEAESGQDVAAGEAAVTGRFQPRGMDGTDGEGDGTEPAAGTARGRPGRDSPGTARRPGPVRGAPSQGAALVVGHPATRRTGRKQRKVQMNASASMKAATTSRA
ncbi:hypothetical protein GCM10010327_61570 [Streptomyces nitrosporeus]|nr:hypothetical protein GCM10010327_61570 [Streptomyces nitrosporeus]